MKIPRMLALLGLLLPLAGCGSTGADAPVAPAPAASEEAAEEKKAILEPFQAPTLEELDSQVTWIDSPVVDALAELRKELAKRPVPDQAAEAAALKLENNSPADNDKIVGALGRLPANDDEVDWNATISRHLNGDLKSTNPLLASASVEMDVNGLTSFGLFGFDWNMRPFAAAETVRSWRTSADGLYDKIVMRDDLVWSDGHPITAHDVVFSFQTILDPEVPATAVRSGTDQMRWVEAYDDHTLVFFHKKPSPINVWNLSFPIIPKHVYEKTIAADKSLQTSDEHVKYEEAPVVGGPYEFVKRVRGAEIVLQRRKSWFERDGQRVRDKPYFNRVIFKVITDPNTALLALRSGNVDEYALTADQWTKQSSDEEFYRNNTKAWGLEWVYFYLGWNCESPFFKDVRVRRAMSLAFDHQEMLESIFNGLYAPCTGVFHETAWTAPDPPLPTFRQDLERAENLLDEAGWTDSDGDGIRDALLDGRRVPFEFSILCGQTPNGIKVCTLLKESLDRIGIICHVRPLEFTVLMQRTQDHEFHAMMGGWGTGTDPYTLRNLWYTGAERNYVNYADPAVDELFDEGEKIDGQRKPWRELKVWQNDETRQRVRERVLHIGAEGTAETDMAALAPTRQQVYATIAVLLYDDQPYTWLFFRSSFYGFNKNLRGFRFSPRGPYSYSPGSGSLWKPIQR